MHSSCTFAIDHWADKGIVHSVDKQVQRGNHGALLGSVSLLVVQLHCSVRVVPDGTTSIADIEEEREGTNHVPHVGGINSIFAGIDILIDTV